MTSFDIHAAMAILREPMPRFEQALIEAMGAEHQTPFHILVATILSLRTKDTLTSVVAPRYGLQGRAVPMPMCVAKH